MDSSKRHIVKRDKRFMEDIRKAPSSRKKAVTPRPKAAKSAPVRPAGEAAVPQPQTASMQTPQIPHIPQMPAMQLVPEKIQAIQKSYFENLMKIMVSSEEVIRMASEDRRFNTPSWLGSNVHAGLAALYVLNAKTLSAMTDAVQTDAKTHARLKFIAQQWIDASSPTNFLATNPEAQQAVIESQGESLRAGIENLMADMRRGRITHTDDEAFEPGHNLALSPGDVIYENNLFQLIQYAPSTPTVGAVPMLFVPPSINKFYIMDLQPESSLVKFTVDQGHTVFLISWRNIQEEDSKITWDDYVSQGVLEALDIVLEVSEQPKANILGFCVGGTLAATALTTLAGKKEDKVNSFTLMTTLLDFSESGVLDVFIDEPHVQLREKAIGKGGLLKGSELAHTFSFLRPNDLVWNYVVNNYLKGQKPLPFDLLYWNADSTNLPGPMFCWYLRNAYLENNLATPGRVKVAGQPVRFDALTMPAYVLGAREDHIVPWESAWRSGRLLGGPVRFVLGASGHIAGSINPAAKNKRSYWTNDQTADTPEQWLEGASEVAGSWWRDWAKWLQAHSGGQVPARPPGRGRYRSIEPAPGRYVRVRAEATP
jgi:polyhydroxyalkanoate synthase